MEALPEENEYAYGGPVLVLQPMLAEAAHTCSPNMMSLVADMRFCAVDQPSTPGAPVPRHAYRLRGRTGFTQQSPIPRDGRRRARW